jgi:tetratricopeptide (TPR) repeat protein
LGTCYGKLGDYKEAINCYDKTLKLNPNYQNAKNNREKAMRKLRGEEITIQGIPLKDIVTSTLIEFNLPFSLSIPDGIYSLKYLGKMYKIHTRQIFRKESIGGLYGGWTIQGSGKVELKYDKWGWFSYSNIRVEFEGYIENAPGLKSKIFDESPRQSLKELSLKIINRFIDVYRIYTKEFFTEPISYSDIFEYQIYYRINNRLKKGPFHSITTSGAMTLSSGISEYPMNFQDFKESLANDQELSLPDIYLLNAKDALFKEDARRATLEGVIALELVLSEFLLKRGIEKGIGGAELKNVLIDIGLTGNLKVSLKLVLKDGEIIHDDLISKCKSAITIRNKIVHEGLREISFDETEERILTIEEFINKLKSFS